MLLPTNNWQSDYPTYPFAYLSTNWYLVVADYDATIVRYPNNITELNAGETLYINAPNGRIYANNPFQLIQLGQVVFSQH